ncbi:MAG TPA: hypothetical protein VN903_15180, partial [Polyangia bacterium]|nr:hypothetical protein [Polyangia bacterium]
MPRRRSYGLTFSAAFNAATASIALLAAAGCQNGPSDNGCQIARQVVLPGTLPLALLPEIQVERLGPTTIVLGSDASSVRWVSIAMDGTLGTEQSVALPPGTIRAVYALAGVDAPGDKIIVGALMPAANGTDAELRLVVVPTDGSPAGAAGDPIATFGGGVGTPPQLAMGTSASGMYAGLAWIAAGQLPKYAFVDGQGQVVSGASGDVEGGAPAPAYSCLGFAPGKAELTVTYQKAPVNDLGPTWFIGDLAIDGAITTLSLNVAPGASAKMSC